jgi:hypothetical protein
MTIGRRFAKIGRPARQNADLRRMNFLIRKSLLWTLIRKIACFGITVASISRTFHTGRHLRIQLHLILGMEQLF